MNENELRARLAEIETELRSIDEEAGDANLNDDQQTRFDELVAERGRVNGDIAKREARRAAVAELGSTEARTEAGNGDRRGPEVIVRGPKFDGADVRSLPRHELRDRALRVLDDEREHTGHLEARQRKHVEALVRGSRDRNVDPAQIARRLLVTENPHYRSAFMKLATRPNPVLTPEEARAIVAYDELRAASLTDAAGGYGVPVLIDPTIILTGQGSPNDILNIARVVTITNDEWKGVSSAGVSWSFDAEAAAVSDDAPTLAQPNVPAHMARGFIPYSIEIGMDYPGFASEMSGLLSSGYAELLAEKLTTGSGSGEPTGIVTALDANTNVEVTPTTDGAFVAADVAKLWDNLPIKYRRNPSAAWMSSTDVQNEVKNFGATYGANMTETIAVDGITRLYGKSYYQNDFMADFTGSTSAVNLLIVGAWENYLVAQRAGMSVELVQHLFDTTTNRPTGQRGWFAWARVGADSVNDLGFRLLQNQ